MQGCFRLLLSVVIVAFWMGSAAAYTIFSEDFSSPTLDSTLWDTSFSDGISVQDDGTLRMVDVASGNTFLFAKSPLPAGPGSYRFEVDFRAELSSYLPDGTFYDLFTVSLGSDTLVEVDAQGTSTYLSSTVFPGQTWNHLVYDFTLIADADVTPWFTLVDQNTILDSITGLPVDFSSDSTVYLDNVQINSVAAPVPEPSTLLLVGAGLAGLAVMRKRTRT